MALLHCSLATWPGEILDVMEALMLIGWISKLLQNRSEDVLRKKPPPQRKVPPVADRFTSKGCYCWWSGTERKWGRLTPYIRSNTVYVRLKMLLYRVDRSEAQHAASGELWWSFKGIKWTSCICTRLWCDRLGTGQTFIHSNVLGAHKRVHAHRVALWIYYRIIQHMKSTLVTLLSITHHSLGLPLPLFSLFLLV